MKITKIYISCYFRDVNLTRVCVASIRYWYPEIRIILVKDESKERFSTKDIEKSWNVEVFENNTIFKTGRFSILSLLVQQGKEHCLYLDSDLVFCGPVLEVIEKYDDDVVVCPTWTDNPYDLLFTKRYYNYSKLKEIDSGFQYSGYCFNAGQIAFKEGVFTPEDFVDYLDFTPNSISNKYNNIIALDDQGLLNYIFVKMENHKLLSIGKEKFMIIPNKEQIVDVKVLDLLNKNPNYPFILHWAGISGRKFIHFMSQSKILIFFNDFYYSKVEYSLFKRCYDLMVVYYQPLKAYYKRNKKRLWLFN